MAFLFGWLDRLVSRAVFALFGEREYSVKEISEMMRSADPKRRRSGFDFLDVHLRLSYDDGFFDHDDVDELIETLLGNLPGEYEIHKKDELGGTFNTAAYDILNALSHIAVHARRPHDWAVLLPYLEREPIPFGEYILYILGTVGDPIFIPVLKAYADRDDDVGVSARDALAAFGRTADR